MDQPVKKPAEEWRGIEAVRMTLFYPLDRIRQNGWLRNGAFEDSLSVDGRLLLGVEREVFRYDFSGLLEYRSRNVFYRGIERAEFYKRDRHGAVTDTVFLVNGLEVPDVLEAAPVKSREGTDTVKSGPASHSTLEKWNYRNDTMLSGHQLYLEEGDTVFSVRYSRDRDRILITKRDSLNRPLVVQRHNQQGEISYHKRWDYGRPRSLPVIHEFKYTYDPHGNWVRCVNFKDGEFISVYTREIGYR